MWSLTSVVAHSLTRVSLVTGLGVLSFSVGVYSDFESDTSFPQGRCVAIGGQLWSWSARRGSVQPTTRAQLGIVNIAALSCMKA